MRMFIRVGGLENLSYLLKGAFVPNLCVMAGEAAEELSLTHLFISIFTLILEKRGLTTEKNRSLSQRKQRLTSGFSMLFLLTLGLNFF